MFLIYTIEDKIILKPDDLNVKLGSSDLTYEDKVLTKAREKYIGKMLLNHGMVVSFKKFILKNNLIVEIEGVINVEYEMDLIIFRPQIGDILYGKITHSDSFSLSVDCDIVKVKVPVEQLMKPNSIDNNIWYWKYDDFKLYYDEGEEVRLKVIEVSFRTSQEISKMISNLNTENQNTLSEGLIDETKKEKLTPDMIMEVLCTFNQEGLGPIKWWENDQSIV